MPETTATNMPGSPSGSTGSLNNNDDNNDKQNEPSSGKIFSTPLVSNFDALVSEYNSLGEYLLAHLEGENSDATIYTDFESGRSWTGAQLREKILNVAAFLLDKHQLRPGTAACIAYDNTDTAQILALGLICAGAMVVCSYPKDPYAELLYLARKVEPEFLFCHAKNRNVWSKRLSSDLGRELKAFSMDEDAAVEPEFKLETMLDYDRSKSSAQIPCPVRDMRSQIALVTMSSGTTGRPKAVPVTHWNCVSDLLEVKLSHGSGNKRGLSFACCASLDYVSGRIILFGAINSGYNAVILDGFQPAKYAAAIERFRIGVLYLGAASFYNLITYPHLDQYDLSSVEMIFPMGAKVTYLQELARFIEKHPNIKKIRQGFGASEIGGAAMNSMSPAEYLRDSENCGHLLPGISAKIVDQNDGRRLLGPGQVGIVHIKGPTVFPGYFDKQVAPRGAHRLPLVADPSVFDHEGFYITGDLGYFNHREQLYIIGREKELMSCRAAKKVLPQELEEILAMHPAVDKAVVLGVPSGQALLLHCPRAFVAPKRAYLERPAELIASLLETRPKVATLNADLEGELERNAANNLLRYTGNPDGDLCSLPVEWRRELAKDLMEFMNERVGWEKQLTGGLILLDEIPTSRATGKIDKNYLRSLGLDRIEIYGDQSESQL